MMALLCRILMDEASVALLLDPMMKSDELAKAEFRSRIEGGVSYELSR